MKILNTFKQNKIVFCGFVILLIYLIIAILVPLIGIIDPVEMSDNTLAMPDTEHLLGTNDIGQDILSRILYSTRQSVFTCIMVAIVATVIATVFGCIGAVKGGICDHVILRITEVMMALPSLVVCLLVSANVRPTPVILVILLSSLEWAGPLKIIRGQCLSSKKRLYVSAARTFGASDFYLVFKHILPDIFPVITLTFIRCARVAVFMESGLAFLGLVDAKTISWGRMIADAMDYTYLPVWGNWLLPVGLVLSILLVSLSYLGYYFENGNFLDKRERNVEVK